MEGGPRPVTAIPSVTSVSSNWTESYTPTDISQISTGSALAEVQATDSPVVIDIYEGNTASNQAALMSYITGYCWDPDSPEQAQSNCAYTAPPNITVETIQTGDTTETAGEYTEPTKDGSATAQWAYTSADADDRSLGNVTAAYTITLTPDGANAESATITAADGTTSTTVIATGGSPSTPAAGSPAGSTAPVAEATDDFTDGTDKITLAFDAQGDFNEAYTNSASTGGSTTLTAGISYGTTLAVDTDSPASAISAGPQQTALIPLQSPTTPVQVATTAAPATAVPGNAEELSWTYMHGFGIGTDDGVVTGVGQYTDEDLCLSDLTSGATQQQQSDTSSSSSAPAAASVPASAVTAPDGSFELLETVAAAPFTVTSSAATQSFNAERIIFLTPYSRPEYSSQKFLAYARASYGSALAVASGPAINATG